MNGGTSALQAKLNSLLNTYTNSESKVAVFVLSHMEQVIYMSVTDLAEQAEVGETTVLRFCRKIGFRGYQEFKLAIAQDVALPGRAASMDMEQREGSLALIHKITEANIKALQECVSLIDASTLDKAIHFLVAARRIHIYGVGTSGITALDAKSKFLRFGISVDAITDPHFQSMSASTMKRGDIVIGISVSGSTRDTVDALRIAKENGANIISITHYMRSPITKLSDVVLLTAGKETPLEGGSLAAKIAQLNVVDMLCTGLMIVTQETALEYQKKTAQAVVDKFY
ncbi:transcriptional regulator [Paenibacillus swuensis]|uniref:Transcriptional regulator n=2 Tax=Paenibacillus swuensis TaxID=1178515 RepID=A0A172TPS6_9BACL|nr:transcriptional regulator [Paenibacillus swuensis]